MILYYIIYSIIAEITRLTNWFPTTFWIFSLEILYPSSNFKIWQVITIEFRASGKKRNKIGL